MTIEYNREAVLKAEPRRARRRQEYETASLSEWSRIANCPICGDQKKKCKVGPKGIQVWCYEKWGKFVIEERFLDDDTPSDQINRWRPGTGRQGRDRDTKETQVSDELLDVAHRTFLDNSDLSSEHNEKLLARGYAQHAIRARCFKSLPITSLENNRLRLVAREAAEQAVAEEWGRTSRPQPNPPDIPFLAGSVGAAPGTLIPVVSYRGHVVAIQTRTDTGGKRYLVAKGSVQRIHYSAPSEDNRRDRRVWITEGPIKGDLGAKGLGARFLAMPGVSSGIDEVIATLSSINIDAEAAGAGPIPSVVVAFDADIMTKLDVQNAFNRLIAKLHAAGFATEKATWDIADGKGIDDLLANNKLPTIVSAEPVAVDPKIKAARAEARAESPKGERRQHEKDLHEKLARELEAAGDTKAAERFWRAARCGRIQDVSSCSAVNCGKVISTKALAAENPLCTHCYVVMLKMLPIAIVASWPKFVVDGLIDVDSDDQVMCIKKQKEVTKALKKSGSDGRAMVKRIRWVRAPGKLMVVSCVSDGISDAVRDAIFASDIAAFALIGIHTNISSRAAAADRATGVLKRRQLYLSRLFDAAAAGDIAAFEKLKTDPWAARFVSTTAGAEAKKSLPWPNSKKLRAYYRASKDDASSMYDVTECCEAPIKHSAVDSQSGTLLGMRIRKPYTFREGVKLLKLYEADPEGWIPPMTIDERSKRGTVIRDRYTRPPE